MKHTVTEALGSLAAEVDAMIRPLLAGGMESLGDEDLVGALAIGGRMLRSIESVLVLAVDEVTRRPEPAGREERLSTRFGCRDVSEVVQRSTRLSATTVSRMQRAARAVHCDRTLVSGALLPPPFPATREALLAGDIGIDGVLAVTGPLAGLEQRVGRDLMFAADAALAATARGEGPDAAPPATADELRMHASAWAVALDQDGSEPREQEALRTRGVTLGRVRNGIVPIHGGLLPEVAAQFQRISDTLALPRGGDDTGGVRFHPDDELGRGGAARDDERTAAQRRHDALATALFAAAASATLPTIGGAAPTLLVSVHEAELVAARGAAHADGIADPLPIGAAHHIACGGVIQRVVLGREGRILRIGTEERIFNRHQRRAIALRDGGCIIPGCGVPAAWSEIHHVIEHFRGGPTHTDNGVLLCWFHHRFLDHHGWQIRMVQGVPEVQAPAWLDPTHRWRRVTKSPTRLVEAVIRRT